MKHFPARRAHIIVAANLDYAQKITRTTCAALAASERLTMKLPRLLTLLMVITVAPLATHAQAPAAAADPIADLQRDTHSGLTVAANPLTDPEQAKSIFGKADPVPLGVLPVEVFLKNDSQQPIRVDIDTIQLTVHTEHSGRQDIDWLSAQEVATLIVHPEGVAPKKPQHIAGIPLPSSDKKVEKLAATLPPSPSMAK